MCKNLKKWNVDVEVIAAHGYQTFQVMAKNKEEALKKYLSGEGGIIDDQTEVTRLEDPDMEDFYEG